MPHSVEVRGHVPTADLDVTDTRESSYGQSGRYSVDVALVFEGGVLVVIDFTADSYHFHRAEKDGKVCVYATELYHNEDGSFNINLKTGEVEKKDAA